MSPLISRQLSSGLAQRTLKNLEFMEEAHALGRDVHIVTQMVNSLLGLLVFPVEKEKRFFQAFSAVRLISFSDLQRLDINGFPPLPSLKAIRFEKCHNLGSSSRDCE